MKLALASLLLVAASMSVHAQGGTGAPSASGQAITPEAASAAERSVAAKHDKRVARKAAKRARSASAAASQ